MDRALVPVTRYLPRRQPRTLVDRAYHLAREIHATPLFPGRDAAGRRLASLPVGAAIACGTMLASVGLFEVAAICLTGRKL